MASCTNTATRSTTTTKARKAERAHTVSRFLPSIFSESIQHAKAHRRVPIFRDYVALQTSATTTTKAERVHMIWISIFLRSLPIWSREPSKHAKKQRRAPNFTDFAAIPSIIITARKVERAHTIWSAKGQATYAEEGDYEEWQLMNQYRLIGEGFLARYQFHAL